MQRSRWIAMTTGLLLAVACATSPPVPAPRISREGPHRTWYTGPELRAELQYRWAARHPADEWLVVHLAVAGAAAGPVAITRDGIRVQSPRGHVLRLATQDEFRKVHTSLFMAIESYDGWQPFSQRFDRSLQPCGNWFFSPPPSLGFTTTVHPTRQRYCSGPLFFLVPGGVQPGPWQLLIELEESTASIPFEVDQ